MPYRKPRVYSGLNAKLSLDTVSTLTSAVKPKVCILNRTTGLPVDIYAHFIVIFFYQYNFSPIPVATAIPQATATPQQPTQPKYWETAAEGKQVYDNVIRNEGNYQPKNQNMLNSIISAIQGGINLVKNFPEMSRMKVSDKYKHAMMNCYASQYGQGGTDIAKLASDLREWNDVRTAANTIDSSQGDNYANLIGRLLGNKYSNGDCNELIQKYIKKNL